MPSDAFMDSIEKRGPHADFLAEVAKLGPHGRVFVVGFDNGKVADVTVHRAVPEADTYIRRDTWKNRSLGRYSYVFFGSRAYWHAATNAWLPYPPEGAHAAE